tara:strand:+ start:142 stop:426 length:285 start_codon:yes stop_codon:yes gene_type:complete
MFFMLICGLLAATGILFLLAKLNIKRVLYFDVIIDVVSTIALLVMFAGTFAGMMAGVIGGAVVSVVLFLLKRVIGSERPTIEGYKLKWITVPPR